MATETIYGVAANGRVECSSATYAPARDGTGTLATTADNITCGQANDFTCFEPLLGFDVDPFWAAYPTAVVSAAELRTTVFGVNASNGKVFQSRLHNWGTTIDTADYVAGGSLSTKTLLASHTQDANTGEKTWTGAGLLSNLPTSGVYRMLLCAADMVNNVSPAGLEYIQQRAQGYATQAERPKLVLTYTIPVASTGAALLACTF